MSRTALRIKKNQTSTPMYIAFLCSLPFFPLYFFSLPLSMCACVCHFCPFNFREKNYKRVSLFLSLLSSSFYFYFFATAKTHTHTLSPLLFLLFSRRGGRKLFAAMEVTLLSMKMFSRVENTEGKETTPITRSSYLQ